APKAVLDIATRASQLIGSGFYGVDIKQSGDRVVVIEINDNPSIESGVEDGYLGEQLYTEIMNEFLRRMEARGRKNIQ
ncbi:MAG: RimK family alpha-L-glutamate ligase, partial [Gammaproteobacteria bacterium]|nr:RimK family alpha-L-glutamate ligase [Gammaproteobacteria bacterium]